MGFIELDLDKISEEATGHIEPELVKKSSIVASEYTSSSLFRQMQSFPKHNIAGLAKKVESEMNAAKNSMVSISNFVGESYENYLNLDNFLSGASTGGTTSSSANAVMGSMTSSNDIHLDLDIPNSKIKLDYQLNFHPVVRSEKSLIVVPGKTGKSLDEEDETL